MNNVIFNPDGLKSRIAVTSSCKVFGEKKKENIKSLLKILKANAPVSAETILINLPDKDNILKALATTAFLQGRKIIDEPFVWECFGGEDHIVYVLELIRIKNLYGKKDKPFADKFLFSHLVIPAKITKSKEPISAIYKNGRIIVKMSNLVVHPFVGRVNKGDKVLIHQATILSKEVDKNTENWLLKQQKQNEKYMRAAKKIKEIDFKKFWGLKDWTIKLFKECGL